MAFNQRNERQGDSILLVQPTERFMTRAGRSNRNETTSKFAREVDTAMIHGVIKAGFRAVVFVPGSTQQADVDLNVTKLRSTEVFSKEFFDNWRHNKRYGACISSDPDSTADTDEYAPHAGSDNSVAVRIVAV